MKEFDAYIKYIAIKTENKMIDQNKKISLDEIEKLIVSYIPELEIHFWTLKKWDWIVNEWDYDQEILINNKRLISNIPAIRTIKYNCPYCEKYSFVKDKEHICMNICPLYIIKQCCIEVDTYHYEWYMNNGYHGPKFFNEINARIYADLLRDTIRAIQELAEYRIMNEIINGGFKWLII